ncbi:toxin MazF, partial [Acetobacter sp. DmW_125132]
RARRAKMKGKVTGGELEAVREKVRLLVG